MYQASQYNYFVPYRDKIIYYNSLHRSRFAMTMAEHQRIRKLFEDPISFSLEYPSVFAQFYQWGFFVDAYTNETAIFRYLYNRDVIFSSHYHLVLANTPQHELSSAFKVPLVKHIKHMLDSKEIRSLCVEWCGCNILNSFESFIRPLFIEADKICKKSGVELKGQIEVNLSNNEVVHNKLYHNKGVPTFRQTLQTIRQIHTVYSGYRLHLSVNAFPFDVNEKENFMKQLGADARKRIHWTWIPPEMWQNETEKSKSATFYRKCFNEGCEEINPEQTVALLAPRKNAAVIYPDGKVYMSIPPDFSQENTEAEGTLNETDGSIRWDEAAREKRLSWLWFERPKCVECRHLPLFAGICPLLSIKIGQICPVENKLIDPEAMIVKEFESKQP